MHTERFDYVAIVLGYSICQDHYAGSLSCSCVPQKIEAPVRNDDSADKSYAYGGKPIGDRQNDVDRLLVDRNEPEEKRFLGTEVAFPDALRFKGAAPEIANSRYAGFMI